LGQERSGGLAYSKNKVEEKKEIFMNLRNYRMTTRIAVGFYLMAGLIAAIGLLSLWLLNGAMAEARAVADSATAGGAALADHQAALARIGGGARTWLIGATVLFASVGAFLGLTVFSAINHPVEEVVAVVTKIASGDLVSKIPSNGKDEFAWLNHELNQMRKHLQKIITEVRLSAEQVSTASGEIAAGNSDLSQRTESQAGSLQETASSMEELTSTVKQNAMHASHANELVAGASTVASRGGQVMTEVVATMDAINTSSRKISDIIGVIDGIAFQTNILALNAAVEAARAGEQGRGFAVVASEVRSLAQRSAEAAKEIKTLIADSVGKVDTGARLVNQAGATMEEILQSVNQVTSIMSEITAASQEQSAGIEQVNRAIEQMDGVTQQNAALVEQSAAAAQSLKDQSDRLSEAVKVFKLA
jgi:methyl-accepting chemotaxis protein